MAKKKAKSGAGKKKTGRKRGAGRQQLKGDGFFGDLWSGVKKAANWVKDNKIISKVGSVIPIPAVQQAAKVADMAGLGRGRHGNCKLVGMNQ